MPFRDWVRGVIGGTVDPKVRPRVLGDVPQGSGLGGAPGVRRKP